jgi:hypothetical protein
MNATDHARQLMQMAKKDIRALQPMMPVLLCQYAFVFKNVRKIYVF